jgi:hypothetical protein
MAGPFVKVTALWIDLGLHGRSIIAEFTVAFAVGMCRRSMGFKREAVADVLYAVAR